jgi:hypothetical protein
MASSEHSVELAGINLARRNHVCAFFNTIDEEWTAECRPEMKMETFSHGMGS